MDREQQDGLNANYILHKMDGSPVDPSGKYFVLKMNSKDVVHAAASRKGLLAYADGIEDELPLLAQDLRKMVAELENGQT